MVQPRKPSKGGKKAEPTFEELVFIYERMRMSDGAILEEMQEEEDLPLRSVGFIKRRRKEFGAAKKVLGEDVRPESDLLVAEARKNHMDDVCSLIKRLERLVDNTTHFDWEEMFGLEGDGHWVVPFDVGQDSDFTQTDRAVYQTRRGWASHRAILWHREAPSVRMLAKSHGHRILEALRGLEAVGLGLATGEQPKGIESRRPPRQSTQAS